MGTDRRIMRANFGFGSRRRITVRFLSSSTVSVLLLYSSLLSQVAGANQWQISGGDISGNTYHNAELGFRYEFPSGWVVSKKATEPEHQFGWKDDPSGKSTTGRCSKTLLFVTKHSEGMRINSFDPMAVVIAVDPECLPQVAFPSSRNDHESGSKVLDQVLDHLKAPPLIGKTPSRVHPFEYGGRVILESSQAFSLDLYEPGGRRLQNLLSSIVVTQTVQAWVIWIFVAANDADLGVLESSKIFFDVEQSHVTESK